MSQSFGKTTLFEDSDDDNGDAGESTAIINVENDYAQKYNDWRRKEMLQKLKDKYGDTLDIMSEIEDDSGEDSERSTDDDDDDDSEESSESLSDDPFDEDFFKVYGALKNKDPKIYDKNFKFFDENVDIQEHKNEDDQKKDDDKLTLHEYHSKLIKEKHGMTEEDESMLNPQSSIDSNKVEVNPGYYEELYNIKKDIENVMKNNDKDADEDDGALFSVKGDETMTKSSENVAPKTKPKGTPAFWSDDRHLDENESFLKTFVLNKAYLNNHDDQSDVIKFKNVASHFKIPETSDQDLSNHSEAINDKIQVSKYHFEEPDATIIKRYPRNISSIRETANNEKKSKRSETRLRKKEEKERELKRLRKLKREEIESRVKTLKTASGIENLNYKDFDLNVIIDDENDFDEEKYDRVMQSLFGDDYYNSDKDNKKPTFDFVPGIDDEANEQINVVDKNKKKKNKKDIKKQKDIMADDDIGLYDDLIGGEVATRFRYRIVEPNDFGLTDEEILRADDKELNKWCSLKKISQHRSKDQELYDRKVYGEKAKNMALKRKIFKSLYGDDKPDATSDTLASNDDQDYSEPNDQMVENDNNQDMNGIEQTKQVSEKKRRKRRRKNKKQTNNQQVGNNESTKWTIENIQQPGKAPSEETNKTSRKRKRRPNAKKNKDNDSGQQQISGVSVQRLKAYGISNRELKKMKHK